MMLRSRVAFAAIAFTVLAGTAACGQVDIGGGPVAFPVADTSSVGPHDVVASPVPEAPGTGGQAPEVVQEQPDSPQTPVPEPTVAKTQRWVKIYSGVSDQEIEPPKDPARGSRTVELNATTSDLFGTYVADGRGMTLYRFDNDSAKPPKATCNGDCAKTWPPLLIKSPGKIFPSGVNPAILGYVERADGHCQVTINGWPVYFYSKDTKPGDILGQGVKNTWFAVSPTGGRTKDPADIIEAPPTPGG